MKQPVIFEMETSDPDDFLTLCWLADHPELDLVAVVATPGGRDQCQLARWALNACGKPNVPIGTTRGEVWWKTTDGQKPRVSAWHYTTFGDQIRSYAYDAVELGADLIVRQLTAFPNATLLVGSAPKATHAALARPDAPKLQRWVQQGFFAGDNLVAPEHRLEKFKGRLTCPSFNPGGAPRESLELLANPDVTRKVLVSKNVCHGVRWTYALRRKVMNRLEVDDGGAILRGADLVSGVPTFTTERPVITRAGMREGLRLMLLGLDAYLTRGAEPDPNIPWEMSSERDGQGKAMHDLVAAAVVLDESVCTFEEVEVYRERGEWGARAKQLTNTFISVAFDENNFVEVLLH